MPRQGRTTVPFIALLIPLLVLSACLSLPAQTHHLTQHNDNARTGANLNENTLTTANVNKNTFGQLYRRQVDGHIFAQPLVVSNLAIPNQGTKNVVFVATMHNSLYAFDADDPNVTQPYWKRNFGVSVPVPNPFFGNRYGSITNISREVGILSTPVIDPVSKTLYCTALTQEMFGGPYHHHLHAIDITTGQERLGSPVEIGGSVPGTGYGSDLVNGIQDRLNGQIVFNPMQAMQRPSLLLSNGVVYIAFGSYNDTDPYHGWVFAYDGVLLNQRGVFCVTPNGEEGGIWSSGQGLAADANGDVYLETGNGTYQAPNNFGDSFVKLRLTSSGLTALDWFTPYNQAYLSDLDLDLGVTGPMLVPNTSFVIGGSKEGKLYVLNRNNLGGFNLAGDTQIPQWFHASVGHLHGAPIYWSGPNGAMIYLWGESDALKAYRLENGLFNPNPFAQSIPQVPEGMPGAMLSLTANGGQAGTGVVWATHPLSGNAAEAVRPGMFRAFDASTLTELWNSEEFTERDSVGNFAKFVPPTVVNGKVYLATFSDYLAVYGLGNWVATPTVSPNGGDFLNSVNVTLSCATPGAEIRYTVDGSRPTLASPLYTGSLTLSDCATLQVRAFKTGMNESGMATANFRVGTLPGSGDGLRGSYYPQLDFGGTPVTRTDPTINFYWGANSPIPGIEWNFWSGRWQGYIQPRCTGPITFTTLNDDGVVVTINNQVVIDDFSYHDLRENQGTISLTAGVKYPITIDYFQGSGEAVLQFYWEHRGQPRQVVPQSQLSTTLATPTLSQISLAYSTVTGGNSLLGTVTLSAATTANTTVALSSGNAAASVPATVVVPAGASSATFPITTSPVASATTAVISATLGNVTKSASLTVNAPIFARITLSYSTVTGGTGVTGTVALNAATAVNTTLTLSRTNSAASVPATVVVLAGASSATFPVTTVPVATATTGLISATLRSTTRSASLTVTPPVLFRLSLPYSTVTGGTSIPATVTLTAATAVNTVVTLSSANPAASVPATVTVPAGASSATFPITTSPVATNTVGAVTATLGSVSKPVTVTVKPPVLANFTLAPNPVSGGNTVTGIVTMNAAVAVDTPVTLTNTNTKATLPGPTVTIPAGQSSVSFLITTSATSVNVSGSVTATVGGVTRSVTLTVKP